MEDNWIRTKDNLGTTTQDNNVTPSIKEDTWVRTKDNLSYDRTGSGTDDNPYKLTGPEYSIPDEEGLGVSPMAELVLGGATGKLLGRGFDNAVDGLRAMKGSRALAYGDDTVEMANRALKTDSADDVFRFSQPRTWGGNSYGNTPTIIATKPGAIAEEGLSLPAVKRVLDKRNSIVTGEDVIPVLSTANKLTDGKIPGVAAAGRAVDKIFGPVSKGLAHSDKTTYVTKAMDKGYSMGDALKMYADNISKRSILGSSTGTVTGVSATEVLLGGDSSGRNR